MHAPTNNQTGVLFVCLGNICRSPLAEGIFIHLAHERGVLEQFKIDSCGTGSWHVGDRADPRSIEIGRRNGVKVASVARQINARSDFQTFDLLIPMDRENHQTLLELGAPEEKVRLMRSFDPGLMGKKGNSLDVPDPYYGSGDGFARNFDMLMAACNGLLDELL